MGQELPFVNPVMWTLQGDKYVDRLIYSQQQKDKKKGFLTGDFKRRDEFAVNFRTEQWREQLKVDPLPLVVTKKSS